MPKNVRLLDSWVPLEMEVVIAMLNLADLKKGEKHIDLGAGDGRFCQVAKSLGAIAVGYEIDPTLVSMAQANNFNVRRADVFNVDVSGADVISAWFTVEPGTTRLINKLYREMKQKAWLVMLFVFAVTKKYLRVIYDK